MIPGSYLDIPRKMQSASDATVEEVCWAEASRTCESPTLMRLYRKLSTYPYLCEHSVRMSFQNGLIKVDDYNPLHHWSRAFEYPWAAASGDLIKTDVVLDAGGGHGPLQYWLAEQAGCVVNVDGDKESLAHVRRVQGDYGVARNLKLVEGDLTRLPYGDGHFDRVFCVSVLEHVPDWRSAAEELLRVTARGGLLLITTDVRTAGQSREFRNAPADLDAWLRSWGFADGPVTDIQGRTEAHFEGCEVSALCVKVRKH